MAKRIFGVLLIIFAIYALFHKSLFGMVVFGTIGFYLLYCPSKDDIAHKSYTNTSSHKSYTDTSSPKSAKIDPYSDILEIIKQYIEIENGNISKEESIRRCDCMLTELDWYSRRPSDEIKSVNWLALWHAVCEHDMVYSGSRYPMGMMSDIALSIQEKNINQTIS